MNDAKFSPNERHILGVSEAGNVFIFDSNTGYELFEWEFEGKTAIMSCDWLDDFHIIACAQSHILEATIFLSDHDSISRSLYRFTVKTCNVAVCLQTFLVSRHSLHLTFSHRMTMKQMRCHKIYVI